MAQDIAAIPNTGTDAPPALARHLNIMTGLGLPRWSEGPQGGFDAVIAAAAADGYLGVQHFDPAAVVAAGLVATGMGRVVSPGEVDALAAAHKAAGAVATTLHVGTGFETDAEADRLIAAVLEASARHGYPLYVETHRATVTQDIRRTLDLVERFPDLRFNADLSHYYCGHELPYGDIAAKFNAMQPIFERVRFLHARLADAGRAQASLLGDPERPFLAHFKRMWSDCFRAFKAAAGPGDQLICAVELLPFRLDAAGRTHWPAYAEQRRAAPNGYEDAEDRWRAARDIWALAAETFAAA